MAIKIVGVGKILTTTANDVVYTPPLGVLSGTVASGTLENTTGANINVFVTVVGPGRNVAIIWNKAIAVIGSPMVLPPITVNQGEELRIWAAAAGMHVALTIGEQR